MRLLEHGRFAVADVVSGLVLEADAVAAAVQSRKPAVLALPVAEELADHVHTWAPLGPLEGEDAVYAGLLGRFGPVELPPRELAAAAIAARAVGARVVGVDVDDDTWSQWTTDVVGFRDLLGRTFDVRRARRRLRRADSAEALSAAWDQAVNQRGFAALERRREAWFARSLRALPDASVLVVLDHPRVEGTVAALNGR